MPLPKNAFLYLQFENRERHLDWSKRQKEVTNLFFFFFILVTNRYYSLSASDTNTILNTFHKYPWIQQPLRRSFLYTVMYHVGLVSRAVKRVYKWKLTQKNCLEFHITHIKRLNQYLEHTKMEIALSCSAKRSRRIWDDLRHQLERSSI